jgi:hypothetical protein
MAVFAVQLDLVNAVSWIDLYVSASKVKVQPFAFRHGIGEASSCNRFTSQIGIPAPVKPENQSAVTTQAQSRIRLQSKFDFHGNIYEVMEELPNETI